jgi:hypothetical protein
LIFTPADAPHELSKFTHGEPAVYCGYGSEIVYVPPVAAGAELAAVGAADADVDAAAVGVLAALDDDDAALCLLDEQATSVLSSAAVATDVDASRRLVMVRVKVLVISGLPGSDGAQMVMVGKKSVVLPATRCPFSGGDPRGDQGVLRAVEVARRASAYGLALIRRNQTRMPPAARFPQVR